MGRYITKGGRIHNKRGEEIYKADTNSHPIYGNQAPNDIPSAVVPTIEPDVVMVNEFLTNQIIINKEIKPNLIKRNYDYFVTIKENNEPQTIPIKFKNIDFYYINLDNRVDKNIYTSKHLSDNKIKAKRFSALSDSDEYGNYVVPNEYTADSVGRKGCLLSHLKLINEFDNNRGKILGIFEDDVQLCSDFSDRIRYIEDNFDKDWDIFFLSSYYHLNDDNNFKWHNIEYELTDIKYIHRVYSAFTTHSYLINPKSIKKIQQLIDKYLPISYAVDHLYILMEPELKCYSFTPGMCDQRSFVSDIGNVYKEQYKSMLPILGKHIYIDKLEDFDYDNYFVMRNKNYVTFNRLGSFGELGNQLFQIAAVYGYAYKYNKFPRFNHWNCVVSGSNFQDIFENRLNFNKPKVGDVITYRESSFSYMEIPNYTNVNVDLEGYFQSIKYFDNCQNEIKKLFKIPNNIDIIIGDKYGDILNNNETVGFHMRFATRGNDSQWAHGSLNDDYFLNCIKVLGKDKLYIVCTDDDVLASAFFRKNKIPNYIIPSDSQMVEFYLLTKTNHVVISNSSFSWWAAYLNDKAINVLCPPKERWFTEEYISRDNKNTSDILLDTWKIINFKKTIKKNKSDYNILNVDTKKAFFKNIIKSGDLVFDVGANIGDMTDIFLSCGAIVICFEPVKSCVDILNNKFIGNNNVIIHNIGLANTDATIPFYLSNGGSTISTFSYEYTKSGLFTKHGASWGEGIEISCSTLDTMINKHGIPDFCKIDVEGFELSVISGLSKKIPCISFEMHSTVDQDILNHLNKVGYTLFNFCIGNTDEYYFDTWVDSNELVIELNKLNTDNNWEDIWILWGDIYCK